MAEKERLEKVEVPKTIQAKVYGYFPINIADETDPSVAKGRAKQFIIDSTRNQQGQATFIVEKVEIG